jgi:sugar (pentulose or hexulose) kinase
VFVGVDLGTTYIKAIGIGDDGTTSPVKRAPTPWRQGYGHVFLDPHDVVQTCDKVVADVAAAHEGEAISAIGITSMGETGVLLEAGGRPLGPALAWFDTSPAEEVGKLESRLGGSTFAARTGVALDHSRSIVKYQWLRAHVPGTSAGARWLNLAEWVAFAVGGSAVNERTLVARTGFFDVATRRPWPEALAAVSAPEDLVRVHEAPVPVTSVSCRKFGGASVVVAGHDHVVAAYGLTAGKPGPVVVSCGTSITIVTSVEDLPDEAERVRLVAGGLSVGPTVGSAFDGYVVQGGTLGGQVLAATRTSIVSSLGAGGFLDADRAAAKALADGEALADAGRNDSEQGALLTAAHAWAKAVLSVWQDVERLESRIGVVAPSAERVVCGRWAESAAFRQAAQATAGALRQVRFPDVADAGCLGAAALAREATGNHRR